MRGLGTAAKAGGLALGAGLATGLTVATKAAIEAEKSQARLEAQLKASGISYKQHRDEIERVIQKHSQLSGLDDEDLQDSFTNIVRITGDVNKALKLNGLAADFARAKGMDVAKAGELVGKVAGGNVGILSRYGITLKDGATASEALATLQQKFAGQAKAYGDTTAGSLDKAKVAGENLAEAAGAALAPALQTAAQGLSKFIGEMQSGEGAGGRFRKVLEAVFNAVKNTVGNAIQSVSKFLRRNREDIQEAGQAARNVGRVIRAVFENVILPVAKRVWPAMAQVVKGALKIIGGVVKVFSALMRGDFRDLWNAVKQIFSGALQAIVGIVRAGTAPLRTAADAAFGVLKSAAKAVFGPVINVVQDIISWIQRALDKVAALKHALPGGGGSKAFEKAVPGLGDAAGRKVSGPEVVLVGEGKGPEYIIPTEPRYRKRGVQLLAQAAADLGIPGFQGGGRFQTDPARYVPTPRQYLRLPLDDLVTAESDAKQRWDSLKGSGRDAEAAAFRRWVKARDILDQAQANDDVLRRYEDQAEIARQQMGLADSKNNETGYRKAKRKYIRNLRNVRGQLSRALKHAQKQGPSAATAYSRELKKAILSVDQSILDAQGERSSGSTTEPGDTAGFTFFQEALADIDLREAAGVITAEEAAKARDWLYGAALDPGAGLTERERLTVMADRRENQPAAETTTETAAEPEGPTADELAQQERADLRAHIDSRTAALNAAWGYTGAMSGDLGFQVVINTLHPGDPDTLRAIGQAAASGFSLQGAVTSPRLKVA